MQTLIRLLLLLAFPVLLTVCSADPKILISVKVQALPAGIESLYVAADLDGFHAETQISGNLDSFAFYLPEGALGRMTLELQGLGPDGCSTAIGHAAAADTRPGSTVELSVAMKELTTKLCPVRIKRQADPTDQSSLVISAPAGIHCGDICTAFFPLDTTIDLEATPRLGTLFQRWTGAPSCDTASRCRVVVTQALELAAQFNDNLVTVEPSDSGRVVSEPPGIDCPGTCSARFAADTQVVLTAKPAIPGKVGLWGDPCQGYTTCRLKVRGPVAPSVRFVDNSLSIGSMNGANLSIVSSPPGINCGATCSGVFPIGTVVTLTADSKNGAFINWSAPCTSGPTCKLVLDQPTKLRVIKAAAPACARGTLCLESPRPFAGIYNAVWTHSPGNAWLVGNSGLIGHWSQDHVDPVPSGTSSQLNAVHGSDPTNVWVVGNDGNVLRYDGQSWQKVPTGNTNSYRGVWAFSRTNVWVVGTGSALHWDGTQLQTISDLLLADCTQILGISPSEIWALGGSGKVVRSDGTSAQLVTTSVPAGKTVSGLAGTGPADLWIGDSAGGVNHYDGTSWQRSTLSSTAISGLQALSDGDLWVALQIATSNGQGLGRFDGQSFTQVPATTDRIRALSASAPDNLWIVDFYGKVFHWDGHALLELSSKLTASNFTAISGSSASHVMVFGPYDSTFRFDGSHWTPAPSLPFESPSSALVVSAADAWAVDSSVKGAVARFDGTKWQLHFIPGATNESFRAVGGSSSDDIWLGGQQTDYHFDGAAWTAVPASGGALGFWTHPADKTVWAISSAYLRKWTGTAWQQYSLPFMQPTSIWGSSASDIWVGGANGKIARFNGTSVVSHPSFTANTITSLWGTRADSVLAAVDNTAFRFDGTSWSRLSSPTSYSPRASWGAGGKVYLVGDNGLLVSYEE